MPSGIIYRETETTGYPVTYTAWNTVHFSMMTTEEPQFSQSILKVQGSEGMDQEKKRGAAGEILAIHANPDYSIE